MTSISFRLGTAGLLLVLAGCIAIPIPGRQHDPRVNSVGDMARGDGELLDSPAFAPKPVIGKQPPHLLLARDGTECIVSQEKFERTAIGRSVWCVWTHSAR
jgi:hypothetical protein